MTRGMFVVVEALDGVGKTTLVRSLAQRLGGTAMDTPGPELRALRHDVLGALGDEQTARCLFYAATVLSQGREARRLADAGRFVVMDRYWGSTISYARARGVTVDTSAIEMAVPRADLTVLLTIDELERRARLEGRASNTAADVETLDEEFRKVVLAELRRRNHVEVDVTGLGVRETVDRVEGLIHRLRGGESS